MRSQILNQIPKAFRRGSPSGRRPPPPPPSTHSHTNSLQNNSIQNLKLQIEQQQQRQSSTSLKQRLFSTSTIRMSRSAFVLEGCTTALNLMGTAEPNLMRGWDAGVALEEDDGG